MQAELPAAVQENLICLLQKCRQEKDLQVAKRVHAYLRQHRLESHPVLGNYLVPTLVDCGSVADAQDVFHCLALPNEHSWMSIISSYGASDPQYCFQLYHKMQQENFAQPNKFIYLALLNVCSVLEDSDRCRSIHADATKRGLEKELFLGSTLVDTYIKCGLLTEAQQVFDKLSVRDAVSWNALITGYADYGLGEEVLACYKQMQSECVPPNGGTFACTLKACATIGALQTGQEVHIETTKKGLETELYVGSTLVDVYTKCGLLAEARQVFNKLPLRNTVSWNTLIAGYAERGLVDEALSFLRQMQLEGLCPDSVTFISCFKACANKGALEIGKKLHVDLISWGLERQHYVYNALVDMYTKCGSLAEARQVLDQLPSQNVVPWNALIAGYTKQGLGQEVLECFRQMQLNNISPDSATFASSLEACGRIGSLETGQGIHTLVTKIGLERELHVASALIDMYGKCGSVGEGQKVFDRISVRDVVLVSAMIQAYGENHDGDMAVQCFEAMLEQGVKPDSITFTCLLAACGHASLVLQGQKYFELMTKEYGIEPTQDQYSCMVDIFARSGQINEAERFVAGMQHSAHSDILKALLTASKTYGKLELGQKFFEHLVEVNGEDSSSYLLMEELYASAGRWNDVNRLEDMRKCAKAKKMPGSAFLEVNKELHQFIVCVNHSDDILEAIEILSSRMRNEGHVPVLDLVLGSELESSV